MRLAAWLKYGWVGPWCNAWKERELFHSQARPKVWDGGADLDDSLRRVSPRNGTDSQAAEQIQSMKLESSNLNRIAKAILLTTAASVGLALSANRLLAQASYEPYTFTHFAGSLGGPGSDDGTGSAARFNFPYGVAVDSSGNVYVADTYNQT